MSSIQINRGTKAEIDNTPVTDGLICFQTDDNFIYMDNGDTREAFGGVKVIPNPQEEPTEVLRNLQIADDVYKISGGHEIEDQSGTTLTQRDVMRFTGAYSHDDSTSEVTKIDIVREMTVAQKDTLTGDEVEGFQWTTDENNDLPLTTDWVAYRDGQSATEALDDAIKEVLNDNGDTLTSRGKIQFVGTYTEDDSTDEVTKVDIVREFNSVSDIENLTGEEAKGFQYLDDDVYDDFTAGDIGFDNSDTSFVGTNVQDVLEEVDNKIDWTLLGNFKFADSGTSYDGDWNLTNNVPTSCNEICFYITVGGGDVGYMPRNSMVIPYSVFSTYKVYYDFNIGTSRVYLQVERVSDSKFKISGVSLGGLTSPMNIYAYAR